MTINIAYSFDDNFAQHGGCSMLSLLDHNQDIETINIFVIDNNISEENKGKLNAIATQYGRKITYLDLEELTRPLDIETVFSRSSYGRLFLTSLDEVDKILYFDSDTIIMSSVKDLWNEDMEGYLTAGVQDTVNPVFVHQVGLTDADRYINAGGVVILNLKLWRELHVTEKCIDFIKRHNGNPPHHDQGTLNYVSHGFDRLTNHGRLKILPVKYNVMNPLFLFPIEKLKRLFQMEHYYSQEEIDEAKANPVVIHFTAEVYNRPWFSNCNHPLKSYYLYYLEKSPFNPNLNPNLNPNPNANPNVNLNLKYGELTRNCKIQNWVYYHCPFWVYVLMVRFIALRHRMMKRVM